MRLYAGLFSVTGARVLMLVLCASASAQPEPDEAETGHGEGMACASCHTCPQPTIEDPCLRTSRRGSPPLPARERHAQPAPNEMVLDQLQRHFMPVRFDHKGHAQAAAATLGCSACHHHTPAGAAPPPCRTCHEISPSRVDMGMPRLKDAYHRQCRNCHRQWRREAHCIICHASGAGRDRSGEPATAPPEGAPPERGSPPIPQPEVVTYRIETAGRPPTRVVFRHREHVHGYDLRCVECHHEGGDPRGHEADSPPGQGSARQHQHQPCLRCHRDDACACCHRERGQPNPAPFDHARTGWPLTRYHAGRSCRVCHTTVPFAKLDRRCGSCHAAWTPENFNHAVTRQMLDAVHAPLACGACHRQRRFDRPPGCEPCHQAEAGVAFPGDRPGPVVRVGTDKTG